ncbi:MAG: quinol:electron acceptor oxidoreductase subunit ActD [Candidatus Nitrospinota bacterium M3_3B_026]
MSQVIFGLFEHIEETARTVAPLEEIPVSRESINLVSVAPYPNGTLFEDEAGGWLWLFALIGGVLGFLLGVALAGGTQALMNLDVGGKPPVSFPVMGVICYETTLLGVVLGVFIGMLWMTGLPDWTDHVYDPEISRGKVGLLVCCRDEEQAERVEAIMKEHGAVRVKKGEEEL